MYHQRAPGGSRMSLDPPLTGSCTRSVSRESGEPPLAQAPGEVLHGRGVDVPVGEDPLGVAHQEAHAVHPVGLRERGSAPPRTAASAARAGRYFAARIWSSSLRPGTPRGAWSGLAGAAFFARAATVVRTAVFATAGRGFFRGRLPRRGLRDRRLPGRGGPRRGLLRGGLCGRPSRPASSLRGRRLRPAAAGFFAAAAAGFFAAAAGFFGSPSGPSSHAVPRPSSRRAPCRGSGRTPPAPLPSSCCWP